MQLKDAMEKATKGPIESYHPAYHADPDSRALVLQDNPPGERVMATWIEKHDAALLAHWYNVGPKLLDMLTCFEDENNHCKVDMHYVRQLLADTNEVKGV